MTAATAHQQQGTTAARARASLLLAASLALGTLAGSAWSAGRSTSAPVSITVIRPVTVSQAHALSFGSAAPTGKAPYGYVTIPAVPAAARQGQDVLLLGGPNGWSPLIVGLTGEPGRAYRIAFPASASSTPGRFAVGSFTAWTQNSGEVTASKLAHFDASGRDTIRIGERLAIPRGTKAQSYTAQPAIAIAYE